MVRFEVGADGVARLGAGPPEEAADGDDYLAALDSLARLDRPFVMLTVIAGHLDLTHEQRKRQNLWFKRTRERLNGLCRAAAIVRERPTPEMQRTFGGLWSFPLLVAATEAEAEAFLRPFLPERAA